ncbi:TrmH family RNA methyltransferase [Ruminococcus flavefaciens]|uniref:tRNA/rRNA methyltransferase SpoU type domain-containing protein n=1 Tax=Ruminococcus flavefaciens 007c TaxID=1341157 RepID=W7UB96_RUMFL|nr:RNA methyltransferase [Ruminococcus flavefaciens]EWM52351.1 hypothetical protein RF007C_13450 [Ruminococcus flavefaciens 007c]
MPEIIEITDLDAEELRPYADTAETRLLDYFGSGRGIFIAESPKVIKTALGSGYTPISLLSERKYIIKCPQLIESCGNIPVYTASSDVLSELTGFKLTQGVLCAMKRKPLPSPDMILRDAERIAVLEDITNQTNIGAVFRSAAALGFDAVVLTPSCSDPLFRRSVRVSMGTVFQLPWTYLTKGSPDYVKKLRSLGFASAAMALRNDTVSIRDPRLQAEEKLAVILGTEGEGLREETINSCDYTIKIPMANGVDSLNVAAASAVAFWELTKYCDI